jgi:hypothetical protein
MQIGHTPNDFQLRVVELPSHMVVGFADILTVFVRPAPYAAEGLNIIETTERTNSSGIENLK